MIILSSVLASLLLVAAAVCLILLADRSRGKAFEKARAEQLMEANRPVSVWICRYCGFMSLMKNQTCSSCDVPRPEEYVYRTIPGKEFAAQFRKTVPKPISEPSEKSV
jgi:ribosomal protein L37E